jgi:hypothetical protein
MIEKLRMFCMNKVKGHRSSGALVVRSPAGAVVGLRKRAAGRSE